MASCSSAGAAPVWAAGRYCRRPASGLSGPATVPGLLTSSSVFRRPCRPVVATAPGRRGSARRNQSRGVGHVKRSITVPLIIGGAAGSIGDALLATSGLGPRRRPACQPRHRRRRPDRPGQCRNGYASGPVDHEAVHPTKIVAIGGVAGFASGISGAGWGPIGVKLLILSGLEPRHAIGSSLVGRITMAVAAIATYAVVAIDRGFVAIDPRLFAVLLCSSAAAMVPGTMVIARLGRSRAAVGVALLSIALATPTLLGWT